MSEGANREELDRYARPTPPPPPLPRRYTINYNM